MIQILAFSKRNAPHIKGILNLTIPLDESPIWIFGQYLSSLSIYIYLLILLEEGKWVKYYRLNPEDVAFTISNFTFYYFF